MSQSPVKARGGGYGLDAELAKKAAAKYDYDMEQEAREWIETITEMDIGEDFGNGLKDGVILCTLANKIHPNVVKRIETKSKMPFKLMENVSNFLKACRVMGVSEFDLFETVDLFELKDLGLVVRCIHALGRAVQKHYPDFHGPTLGVKEAQKNERQFSHDQLAEARAAPSLLSLGSSRVMERLDISRANDVTFGADATQISIRAPPPPPPPSDEMVAMVSRERAAPPPPPVEEETEEEQAEQEQSMDDVPTPVMPSTQMKPPMAPSPVKQDQTPSASPVPSNSHSLSADIRPTGLSPTKPSGATPLDEAREWIEAVLNQNLSAERQAFGESLRDGVVLCTLMNTIQPNLVKKIEHSKMPFKQMENISNFLKACRHVGVQEFDLFETVDLFELKNLDLVINCLHALGRAIQKNVPEFQGPTLGVKEATANKRRFSPAQLKEAANAVSMLSLGSSTVMDRRGFDRSASITWRAEATGSQAPVEAVPLTSSPTKEQQQSSPGKTNGLINRMAASSASGLPTRTVWS